MATPESIAQMELDADWQRWAEQGWTLHQTPDGKVMAANVARHLATNRAKHLDVLIDRLEHGIFATVNLWRLSGSTRHRRMADSDNVIG